MTTQDIINYYADLLILQYVGKPRAYATIQALVTGTVMGQLPSQVQDGFNLNPTVQTITFSDVAASGSFTIGYGSGTTSSIAWNAPLSTIQAAINTLFGVGYVAVTGGIATKTLTLTFNINPSPGLISVPANTLQTAGAAAISSAVSANLASGVQLDVLGKYAGVTRSGFGSSGPISLSDSDFYRLIQLAVVKNTAGSSLSIIQSLLAQYFPNEILVFDYANTNPMSLSYCVSTSVGSQSLIQLFISEGLLPKPMGVSYSVIGAATINKFYGMSDYFVGGGAQPVNTTSLNSIAGYDLAHTDTTYLWMDYIYSLL